MYFHVQELITEIVPDEPDPAANALKEGRGGKFGEMRTMVQHLFQSFNFRGPATQYKDLIHAVAVEEISHVKLIATMIVRLLDGVPGYVPNGDGGVPGAGGGTQVNAALGMGRMQNIHHFLVGARGAMPVDAVGNPCMGSCVYNGGNLMLESTGRPRKYRIYEMSTNKTPRATVAYLIVRDEVHEKVDAKALESFGADWGKSLPIPSFGREQVPRGAGAPRPGIGDGQWTFRLDGSRAGEVLHGNSPLYDGPTARTADRPEQGFAIPQAPERPEEFAPGLTPELMGLTQAAAALATKGTTFSGPGMSGAVGTAKVLGKVRTDGTETPLKGGDHIEVSRGEAWTTTMRTKK